MAGLETAFPGEGADVGRRALRLESGGPSEARGAATPPGGRGARGPHPDFTLEILKTLEKSHVGGWFPWGFLPAPDRLILWSVPDVCKDVDLDVLVDALKPVGTFKKIGKVFRREEDSTVGLLQIGEDVDHLLIPREVRLAGGVWRVISKPATKEAEFRERLARFLEEEGRTLEDVARIIEKSTPHPPQPPPKPKGPRARRRVPQMATPPPRLVVGTYDSSNASDSEFSDFEASRKPGDRGRRGPARAGKARKMPVSYLGSKFLGSDLDSEDDEELVEAFLRRGEKQPGAQPARRCGHLPVPMFEDGPGPQPPKGDRWREYVSQVSWGKLRRRVKGWAPRSGPGVGEAQQASVRVERDEVPCSAPQGDHVVSAGGGLVPEVPPRRWRPKIKWASFRLLRREEAASMAQGAEAAADQRVEAVSNQRVEAAADQRVEAVSNQRVEAAADQRAESAADQRAEAVGNQRVEAAADQRAESAADQRVEAVGNQRVEAAADQRVEAAADQRAESAADQRVEAVGNQRAEAAADQGAEAVGDQRAGALVVQGAEAAADQGAEAAGDQRAGAPVVQGAEAASDGAEARAGQRAEASAEAAALAAQGATGATPGARARKQVKTVRFQTPGRFSWFRKRRRAFWHTPRLPTLPKRVPRAGEAGGLRVLRAEARAEAEPEEQEDLL
ncbi:coiled-coil domain-containing protein 8 [Myotis daubentonii]|uniref:coiled-coil domain-containing protein 8 n=1 Tax=Myotis daubentonii TaxID=98922 RepID=UPI002872E47E|nr:coiled-coil domain-containing protein 8 [Myotis daubentonii]